MWCRLKGEQLASRPALREKTASAAESASFCVPSQESSRLRTRDATAETETPLLPTTRPRAAPMVFCVARVTLTARETAAAVVVVWRTENRGSLARALAGALLAIMLRSGVRMAGSERAKQSRCGRRFSGFSTVVESVSTVRHSRSRNLMRFSVATKVYVSQRRITASAPHHQRGALNSADRRSSAGTVCEKTPSAVYPARILRGVRTVSLGWP